MKQKKRCDDCGNLTFRPRLIKGKLYCYKCSRKRITIITEGKRRSIQSMEKALSKVYTINACRSKQNGRRTLSGARSFPSILIGHKIMIRLVD